MGDAEYRADALKAGILIRALELLKNLEGLPRRQELEEFYARIHGKPHPDMTKYFEKAAMVCHHFDGIYVGAKFMNNRILGAEICNREGELCYNMSYGTHTCIMRSGKEYDNINPVWDYARIPGTTSRPESDEELLKHRDWWKKALESDHFGGKQSGGRAVIYEEASHDDINVLAADFAFEGGFVCLGAGVSSRGSGVITTVDQCLVHGDVIVENNSVIHNGIRYTALNDNRIEADRKTQWGSWYRNNRALSEEPVGEDVLTLTIAHEKEPIRYAYMISAADRPLPKVEVIQNDESVQALRLQDGSILAVFHRPCVLRTRGQKIRGETGTVICCSTDLS